METDGWRQVAEVTTGNVLLKVLWWKHGQRDSLKKGPMPKAGIHRGLQPMASHARLGRPLSHSSPSVTHIGEGQL